MEAAMTETKTHAPGTFCWLEIMTPDPNAARKFYGELFGWTFKENPMPDGSTYLMPQVRNRDVGGLYKLGAEQAKQGTPPHVTTYVAVASADEAAKRAKAAGGKVMMEPFDVMQHGRVAVLQDPTGAAFAVWQAKQHPGFGVMNEPFATCWNELLTRDVAAAEKFYTSVFGWTAERSPMAGVEYTLFKQAGQSVGGMAAIEKEMAQVPPHWLVYFGVDRCDDRAKRAGQLGGKTVVPPQDIPNVGRFAVLQDPQGVTFGILQPTQP
jgi:predicted enzyme related to lactoylglutathione lyase